VCAEIPRVATRTHVTIIRHHLERHRSSNTGRLAALALPNSTIIEHGGPFGDARFDPSGAVLVFPAGHTQQDVPTVMPTTVIVLDASWSQARRMWRKIDSLRGVPTLSLPKQDSPAARLRKAPADGMVSTIEAIAAALRLVEGEAVAAPLEALFANVVDKMRRAGRNGITPVRNDS
jgi:DTW domain-containing protein